MAELAYRKWLIGFSVITILLVITVTVLSIAIAFLTREDITITQTSTPNSSATDDAAGSAAAPLPWPKPSSSPLAKFTRSVVASDNGLCAEIGRQLMIQGGNVIDAILGTNICQGAMNAQSSGIGGGFFLTYYDRSSKKCYSIDARETAPALVTTIKRNDTKEGYKAIAVPGEVAGMRLAHSKFGKLSWAALFRPTILYLRNGYPASGSFAGVLHSVEDKVKHQNGLDIFINNATKKLYQQGDIIKRPILADTLETLANSPDPVHLFYRGDMADTIVKESEQNGGLIRSADLANYTARFHDNPVAMRVPGTDYTVCGPPPPSSASVIAAFLNVLSGMNISPSNLTSQDLAGELYNNMVETYKFIFAARSRLGDRAFVAHVDEVVKNITSPEWANWVRAHIPTKAQQASYYGGQSQKFDSGTTHMSAIDKDGNAAGITASVNFYFGAKERSKSLGIVWNNQMNDFSFAGTTDDFGLAASNWNLPEPGKRPMSSMSPMVLFDHTSGEPSMVLGAAGGSRIVTSVAYVASRVLWLNETIKQAIDAPRFHQQLTPNITRYESFMPEVYPSYLHDKHDQPMVKDSPREISVVCGLHKRDGFIFANSDFRKPGGYPAGF